MFRKLVGSVKYEVEVIKCEGCNLKYEVTSKASSYLRILNFFYKS